MNRMLEHLDVSKNFGLYKAHLFKTCSLSQGLDISVYLGAREVEGLELGFVGEDADVAMDHGVPGTDFP